MPLGHLGGTTQEAVGYMSLGLPRDGQTPTAMLKALFSLHTKVASHGAPIQRTVGSRP